MSFHCTEFDFGDEDENGKQEVKRYMSASLTVACSSDDYEEIKVLAIISMLIVPTSLLSIFAIMLLPITRHIEARNKRSGVAPTVDFLIGEYNSMHAAPSHQRKHQHSLPEFFLFFLGKWKPTKWYFVFLDLVSMPVLSSK